MNKNLVSKIQELLHAYKSDQLGDTTMPEDTHPVFPDLESKRVYYTLPMALNYQRNSYKMWEAAKATFEDKETRSVFDLKQTKNADIEILRQKLLRHKLALQPNKHIDTWSRISKTIASNWGSITKMIEANDSDYLQLRETIQKKYKKGFPYLSGPKIFNYWMFIMSEYGEVDLKNREYIEIAPDTHVIQASVKLGVISKQDSQSMTKEEISSTWRQLLTDTGIDPIDVHSPLWFWSRSGFEYKLPDVQ